MSGAHRLEGDPVRTVHRLLNAAGEVVEVLAVPAPVGPGNYRHAGALVTASPVYSSWSDFLTRTSEAERRAWCAMKAKVANRQRLLSAPLDVRLRWTDVWAVLDAAEGRCAHCGSLAVERRPSTATGAPAPWHPVGRRIGSLDHHEERIAGGSNGPGNLGWSCLWCNTWPSERRPGATDYGGFHPR